LNKRAKKTSGKNKEIISSENGENLRQGGDGVGGGWKSFIIGSEVRISLLKLSPVQHEQVNNSYNPEVVTYQKHWHFSYPLYFQVALKPQYVLVDFLSLTSDLSEINLHFIGSSKIQKDCIVPSEFRKIQFYA